MLKAGWHMGSAPAVVTVVGGVSAGTFVAVRSHRRMAPVLGSAWDHSPPGSGGRVAAAWVDGVVRGGLLVVSLYLWTNECITSGRNVDVLGAAAQLVRAHGGPYVIGGDWQNTPDVIAGSQWLGDLGGVVLAAGAGTCTSRHGRR